MTKYKLIEDWEKKFLYELGPDISLEKGGGYILQQYGHNYTDEQIICFGKSRMLYTKDVEQFLDERRLALLKLWLK